MEKYFVLRNSLDNTLYYKDQNSDTRLVNESKRFINRSLAEKFITSHKLSESYSPRMVIPKRLSESVDSKKLVDELQSALDDCKEMVDTTIDLIECYTDGQLLEEVITDSDVEEIIKKLNKIKSYMAGISFYPSFDNSLGSCSGIGGESSEESV